MPEVQRHEAHLTELSGGGGKLPDTEPASPLEVDNHVPGAPSVLPPRAAPNESSQQLEGPREAGEASADDKAVMDRLPVTLPTPPKIVTPPSPSSLQMLPGRIGQEWQDAGT